MVLVVLVVWYCVGESVCVVCCERESESGCHCVVFVLGLLQVHCFHNVFCIGACVCGVMCVCGV